MFMLPGVQARDIADGFKNHLFLSKHMPLRSGYSQSSIGDNGKFIAHYLNHMQHRGRTEASLDHKDLAEEAPTMRTVDTSMTYGDKPAHQSAPTQDTVELTPTRA